MKKSLKVKVNPLGDRVLIRAHSIDKEKTISGIIIPDTASKDRPEQGVVIAVGPGKRDEDGNLMPMSVKKGDTVIFTKYGPEEIKIDDEDYLIVSESNILAVIEE